MVSAHCLVAKSTVKERIHDVEKNVLFGEEKKESNIAGKVSTGKAAVTNKDVTTTW